MEINDITGEIVRSAMKVHTVLGAGLAPSGAVTGLLEAQSTTGWTP